MKLPGEEIAALYRYFIWANFMRTKFDALLKIDDKRYTRLHREGSIYMSYWYGGLYVVIEGWRKLALADLVVDALLKDDENVGLLRRYRNGAFHYQPKYFDDRFTKLIASKRIVLWIRKLNRAFAGYFLRRLSAETRRRAGKP